MKICFVGLGSIGKRHLKNLLFIGQEKSISIEIDALRSHQSNELIDGIQRQFFRYDEIDSDYDIIFICNPTFLHFDTLIALENKAKFFFIEKPVFNFYMENLPEFISDPNKYYVACPMRYCATLNYIKINIDIANVLSCRSICSTYLPDWRKGVDYRSVYSAHKDQGGGVIIDIIHELDYLIYLFGIPEEILGFSGKFSRLEIDCEDLAIYIAKYKSLLVELHLDYFGKVRKREIELYTEEDIIVGDLDKDYLYYKKSGEKVVFCEDINQRYIRELEHVLDILNEASSNDNNITFANEILRLAQSIEEKNYD